MGPRAWEARGKCVPSRPGSRRGAKVSELVPGMGQGLHGAGQPRPGSQGAAEMSFCCLNKAALSRALI